MSVSEFLQSQHDTAFSFEVLPPVKGKSIEQIYRTIDRLKEFNPAYINITTHRSDTVYHETSPGVFCTHTGVPSSGNCDNSCCHQGEIWYSGRSASYLH